MKSNLTVKEQFRRNTVALISLAVAVTSLGYNTWRNEASEHNRNQRLVAIELLLMLGDLQQLTLDRHYGRDVDGAAILRKAWAKVLTIRDISQVAEGAVPASARALYKIWGADYGELGADTAAKDRIIAALELVRHEAREILQSLD
ncbi:MAG: hypothetical protein IH913_09435 [Proteobacteria bacterium]|nr:hypothetical protein [Pseudomonadota bacterium]